MNRKTTKHVLILSCLFFLSATAKSQSLIAYADSIRKLYQIPELGYAVVTADNIVELNVLGVRRINTGFSAKLNDKFHISTEFRSNVF